MQLIRKIEDVNKVTSFERVWDEHVEDVFVTQIENRHLFTVITKARNPFASLLTPIELLKIKSKP